MYRLINRYILREIAVPFAMILLVITFVLLMGKILQVMDLMINKGIGFTELTRLMLYLLPSFLTFTIPVSLLIAILIGLGRLSGDNEWTILKVSGISLYRLSYPVASAALVAFLLTLSTTVYLVPYGNLASRALLIDMARQKASIGIREKVFIDYFQGILLYAERIPPDGDFLEGVLISDSRTSREPSTIIARRAYLVSNPATMAITLRLEDGSTHSVDGGLNRYRKMDFRFYDLRLDFASGLAPQDTDPAKSSTEMTLSELATAVGNRTLKEEAARELAIELHKKLTVPLSCLVFALIGIPLGIRAHRSVRARGFTVGLFLVLTYYLLRLVGEAFVETGRITPALGAWLPNGIYAVTGALLFSLSAREVSLRRFLGLAKALPDVSTNGAGGSSRPGKEGP